MTGTDGSIVNRHALFAFLHGELSDKNGSLGRQTHQHDDTHLHIYVDTHTHQHLQGAHRQVSAEDTKRDGQQHREGDKHRVIQHGEDEVDQQYGDGIDDGGGVGTGISSLLTCHTAKLIAVAFGEHLFHHLIDGGTHMRRSIAWVSNHVNVVAGKQVETALLRGAHDRGHGDQPRHWSHLFACLNVNVVERARFHAILIARLHNHIVHLAIFGVGADIRSSEVSADGLNNGPRRNALAYASRHINGKFVFRIVGRIGSHRYGHLWAFIQFLRELGRIIDEGRVVVTRTVLEVQLYGRT